MRTRLRGVRRLRCHRCRGPAKASNPIGARPGQKVVVQSDTQKMLRIVALVYLIPVVLFLAGYVIPTHALRQHWPFHLHRGTGLCSRHFDCGAL